MKRLVFLLLVILLAGNALAYNYQDCIYRIGVFFSSNEDAFAVTSMTTNIDYEPFQPFYMHLVITSTEVWLGAYEMKLEGLPAAFQVEWIPLAGTGWINVGNETNHIAAFGFPQPYPGGVTHLGRWRLNHTSQDVVPFEVSIGPSVPSSIGGDGPAIVVVDELWRLNFTPMEFSGCESSLPPGVFPPFVATGYGDGVSIGDGHPVAVQTCSFSAVKELFR